MGDNIELPDRNGVRTPMQWEDSPSAGFSTSSRLYLPVIDTPPFDYHTVNVAAQQANPSSLWHVMRRMIRLRKQHPVLAEGGLTWLDCGTTAVMAFIRSTQEERLLAVHNLSSQTQSIQLQLPGSQVTFTELHTGQEFTLSGSQLALTLVPHQYLWLE
jgi:maltose alpha-D-glucosyltransferase/alpha-amylase